MGQELVAEHVEDNELLLRQVHLDLLDSPLDAGRAVEKEWAGSLVECEKREDPDVKKEK